MKKYLYSALAVFTSLLLMPFQAFADDIETGVVDMSEESIIMGETDGFSLSFQDFPEILGSSESTNYRLGDYLDANNKLVYEKLAKLVTPSLNTIKINLPEPVSFTTEKKQLSGSDMVLYNAVFGSCSSGLAAVLFDMPEIFWLNQNGVSVSPNEMPFTYNKNTNLYTYTIETITITPKAYSGFKDINEILEYKEILEKAVEDFEVMGDTKAEKLRFIHNKIAKFTYYDTDADFSGSALSSLVTKGSVCEGYSKGFKMICDRLGIPCVCVFGNFDQSKNTAHMWNYVLMDDNCWYAIDVTWDDKDGKNGVEVNDVNFLKGSDDFFKEHTEFEEYITTKLKYPELATWNYGENPNAEYEYGDVNRDGKVSLADLVCCASFVLGDKTIKYNCDVDGDGRASVFDVIILRKLVAEKLKDIIK